MAHESGAKPGSPSGSDRLLVLDLLTPGEIATWTFPFFALLLAPLGALLMFLAILDPQFYHAKTTQMGELLVVTGLLFALCRRALTDCYYVLDSKEGKLLYHRRVLGVSRSRPVADLGEIHGVLMHVRAQPCSVKGCWECGAAIALHLDLAGGRRLRVSDWVPETGCRSHGLGGSGAAEIIPGGSATTAPLLRAKSLDVCRRVGVAISPDAASGPWDRSAKRRSAAVVGLAWAGMGLMFLAMSGPTMLQSLHSRKWAVTRGVVIEARISSYLDESTEYWERNIVYRYAIGRQSFTNHRVHFWKDSFSSAQSARAALIGFPVGSACQVYYDPEHPGEACLEPGMTVTDVLASGAVLAFVAAVIVFGLADFRAAIRPDSSRQRS